MTRRDLNSEKQATKHIKPISAWLAMASIGNQHLLTAGTIDDRRGRNLNVKPDGQWLTSVWWRLWRD